MGDLFRTGQIPENVLNRAPMKALNNQDRRVLRTRQLVLDALLALIREQGYDSITVQEIIDRANIGRSTFYAHFKDKDDLLIQGLNDIIHSLVAELDIAATHSALNLHLPIICVEPLFRHAEEEFKLHRAIFGSQGIHIIIHRIRKHLSEHIQEKLEQLYGSDPGAGMPLELLAFHLASTAMNLLRWWLDNNRPYSPQDMDRYFQHLTMIGAEKLLKEA